MGIYCLNDNYIRRILFSTSKQIHIFAPINQQKQNLYRKDKIE